MPSVILVGALQCNTPQQNAGAFIGEWNFAGWDANRKMSQTHGGTFGFFNWLPMQYNVNWDSFEYIDGAINDADAKPIIGANV
ncbi:hypothetical protein JI721_12530 [Alicyclobacillus cycloheptanicus]|uniref:Uncharacterized protein n=1 Tax=Alicyclobacillus cycloheptanicus TaxID=1457 RepID=A0ABT9XEU7_9BACL|nr:hypothetical protein [Alicyclobacillus cycloheptanicus]MDQ0188819.1 hypothetical protein [Alicyclobacillus cycloheptanicus]WDM00532.1 hypothetical protein JI721_12530 [Alicyclobacillus cycloheptanicus]